MSDTEDHRTIPKGGKHWPAPFRFPDPKIRALDKRFRKYMVPNAAVERLYAGTRWSEGPVWFGDMRCLIWSDIPNNRMMRWDAATERTSVFRQHSGFANGNTRDRQGRLITCEQDTRRVTRTEIGGRITVLMDSFEGKRLNSPNDVVVKSDGSIWFSDPGYGVSNDYEGHQAEMVLPRCVYRIDPATGRARIVTDAFARPNGLCFSPDERRLYIGDTSVGDDPDKPATIHVMDVGADGTVSNSRLFHDFADHKPGFADGLRTDADGNLWCATGWAGEGFDGVHIFAPDGDLIGQILMPEICGNLCFGGDKHSRLFMAASTSLYCVDVNVVGASDC